MYKIKFKKSCKHVFIITLLFSMYIWCCLFQLDLLAAVYEIVRKPIVLSTYCLSIHLFYFRSKCWCETLISGAKDIWDYGWALSPSCLFNGKVLNQRDWNFSQRSFCSGNQKIKGITLCCAHQSMFFQSIFRVNKNKIKSFVFLLVHTLFLVISRMPI